MARPFNIGDLMKNLVNLVDGSPMASSNDIAEVFGKIHRNVKRDIENLIGIIGPDLALLYFEQSTYTSKQNKTLPCYMMNRDGFSLLAMGFTGRKAIEWKIKYIQAFNAMESALLKGSTLMARLEKEIESLEQDKAIASGFGRGLSEWKTVRRDHQQKIDHIMGEIQMTLPFNPPAIESLTTT